MKIAITGHASISPLGHTPEEIKNSIYSDVSCISWNGEAMVSNLTMGQESILDAIREHKPYKSLDKTAIMAIFAARQLGIKNNPSIGVNIGSSRGATEIWEQHYESFKQHPSNKVSAFASPHTTLGNISSWVAQDLGSTGMSFSHSITCSTALHSIANAVAWLESGMATSFLAGGSEAPLTPFTIQQMKAVGIYSTDTDAYPCKPLNGVKNSMVLGEGAAIFQLEREKEGIAYIKGVGFATEKINHAAGISSEGECIKSSMKLALSQCDETIDLILLHAPGTVKGDAAELHAIDSIFQKDKPVLWSNKWKIGHTLGASGALSLESALYILKHQNIKQLHQLHVGNKKSSSIIGLKPIKNILINAVGFGGNAVSIIVGV